MINKVCIFATEVSKLSGMHKYESREKAIAEVLKRYKLDSIKALGVKLQANDALAAVERESVIEAQINVDNCMNSGTDDEIKIANDILTRANASLDASLESKRKTEKRIEEHMLIEEKSCAISRALEDVDDILIKTVKHEKDTTDALGNVHLKKSIEDAASHTSTERVSASELQRALEGEVACRMGNKLESVAINAYEKHNKVTVNQMQTGYKSDTLVTELDNNYIIYGRTDGLDGDTIIESKNRKNRFLGVPLYEKVQIHAYMYITNKSKGKLLENFNGDQREHNVVFDPDFWEDVMQKLSEAVDEICDLAQR